MSEESGLRRRTDDRVKDLEEKVERMCQNFEYGPAVQAAFQAGEGPEEPQFLPRKGFNMLQFQRSGTGLTDDCIEALMANLTALDGLGAGDLARRLDRMEERLEELLRCVLSSGHLETRPPLEAATPQPPQELPPSLSPTPTGCLPKYLSEPPTALTAVMEEATSSTGLSRRRPQSAPYAGVGDESITAADMEPDAGAKFIEVQIQRPAAQPSWGLLWDRKCFDKKRRVIEAIVPSSPAGLWNQERADKGEEHLQRGDELVKLNGKLGWEACSDLTNLQAVQLLFRRPSEQERASSRGRRNSHSKLDKAPRSMAPAEATGSFSDSQRVRTSPEARGKSRQSLSSGSPSRGTGGSLNSIPQTPSMGACPTSLEQPPLQRCTSPPVKSQDSAISDPQNTIQVLQAALAGGPNAQRDLRGMDLAQTPPQPAPAPQPAQLPQPAQPPVPSPREGPQDVSQMVAAILNHSRSVRAADPGKASLISPTADELNRLASHLLAGEAGLAMSLVISLLQKSVQGPDGRVQLVPVEQTEAAQYLLDLLTLLDSQQTTAAK